MNAHPLKTVFLDYDTVSNGDLDTTRLRAAAGELVLYESNESKIAERIHDADVALLNKLELTRELLSGAPRLKLVALAATGTNNVDLNAARELGIAVCNVRAYCTAGFSAWSAGASSGAALHASPKPSACGLSSPTVREPRLKGAGYRSMSCSRQR